MILTSVYITYTFPFTSTKYSSHTSIHSCPVLLGNCANLLRLRAKGCAHWSRCNILPACDCWSFCWIWFYRYCRPTTFYATASNSVNFDFSNGKSRYFIPRCLSKWWKFHDQQTQTTNLDICNYIFLWIHSEVCCSDKRACCLLSDMIVGIWLRNLLDMASNCWSVSIFYHFHPSCWKRKF